MDETQTNQPKRRELSNLTKRCLTAAVYVAVLFLFFVLKLFLSDLFFDALILALALIGTWEMTRAFKDKMHGSQKTIVMVFAALIIVTYSLADYYFQDLLQVKLPTGGILDEEGSLDPEIIRSLMGRNYSLHITFVVFMTGISVLLALLVFAHKNVTLESTGYALLSYMYPSFLLLVLSVCNHLQIYSELALLFIFVVSPFADTFAFFFGKLFGKYLPAKMAPSISPKKTLIGGLGGLIGGAIGAVAIFFTCYGLTRLDGSVLSLGWSIGITPKNLIFFIGVGILTSAFSQFGDLVESAIKRKLEIKDMGKILPGHGGILDRIDSSLYAGLIVCLAMVVRIMMMI